MVQFSGRWTLCSKLPEASLVFKPLKADRRIEFISFDSAELVSWDTSILTFLMKNVIDEFSRRKLRNHLTGGYNDSILFG
jgi:hypothetical protein